MTRRAVRQRMTRGAERVTLRIDRLDLLGFPPRAARRIADSLAVALERELAGLERLPEVPERHDKAAATIPACGTALPEDIGATLAQTIVGRIKP